MRVGIIYDFGVNKGGGDFVMLNIIEALSSKGYNVSLVTSNPYGLHKTVKFFGKNSPNIDICCIKAPRFLKHPYTIAYMAGKAVKNGNYDVYIVSDDIPKCISDEKGICYIHYPHAARFKFKEYMAHRYKGTLSGSLMWHIHKTLFPRLFLTDVPPENWLLIANSTVTRKHVAEVFHINDVTLLNPPVSSLEINSYWKNCGVKKEDMAVCIGRFEPEKRFMDVLHAITYLKGKLKLSLIGFTDSEGELVRAIKELGLEKDVELLVNADRKTLVNRLLRAKAIVHPTPHEPFGMAVVEGMAAGCIPIVRRGFNGPWMEITQEGKYGLGFSSIGELGNILMKAIRHYDDFDVNAITSRALMFDETIFREKFLKILQRNVG